MDWTQIALAFITVLGSVTIAYFQTKSAVNKKAEETMSTAKATATEVAQTTGELISKTVLAEQVLLEKRLATLETNQIHIMKNMFNNDDRRCLAEVEATLNLMITTLIGDALKGLRNPPKLDALLIKMDKEVAKQGTYKALFTILENLTPEEDQQLTTYLETTIKSGSAIKQQRARLVLGMKKLQKEISDDDFACELDASV